ncbi:hypothetical protein OIU77_009518 [Salix suchowensis]|uniref:Apple domain-containing protein n=1 Tax=Salix suchowensis TaxID=1278906 RepID=A0ABQ9AET2_9ROSI|nr:hypothetical protein OIU77_009518 [Salix suchowensis]
MVLIQAGFAQLFLNKDQTRWWRGGPWTGQRWSGVPEMTPSYIFNVTFVSNLNEVSIIDGSGFGPPRKINVTAIVNVVKIATVIPYKADDFICNCLPGFEPVSPREWYLRDGSKGCIRKPNVSTCHSGEGFVKLARVKVPDTSMARANMSLSLKECEQECSRNCSCTAYASADERGIGCLRWHGDLVDMRTYTEVGQEIYIRVDAAELAKYRKSRPLAKAGIQAALIVSVGVALFLIVFLVCCFIRKKKKGKQIPSAVIPEH